MDTSLIIQSIGTLTHTFEVLKANGKSEEADKILEKINKLVEKL